MATERRLIDATPENIKAVLEKVPYYPDEIWKFTAMTKRFPEVEAVEVVHGRWIFDFSLDDSNFYKCSICGRQEILLAKESISEYCPYCHCGAKMDEHLSYDK